MNIKEVKKQIELECKTNKNLPSWFYTDHLLMVEKNSKCLLKELPKADSEVVLLGVWLHDLQRVRGLKGDHQSVGAREAVKVMKEYGYDKAVIEKVKAIILTHSCDQNKPTSIEGKILATADAMSHYYNDFFLRVAVTGQRDLKEFKEWVLEKLDRNFNKKIFFASAKKKIKPRHELYKKVFSMK
jgi:HD superfamily phosphodiesterase